MNYNHILTLTQLFNIHKEWMSYHAFDSEEFQILMDKVGRNTLVSPERLCIIYQLAKQYKDYKAAELGVYKGGTAYIIASQIKMPIYLYDTFEGMPETTEFDLHSKGDFNDCSFEAVSQFLKEFDNVFLLKGIFPESAFGFEQDLGFVHLDADIYESTKIGLEYFYPRVIKGGSIILDDYDFRSTPGVKKAVDEFLLNKNDLFLSVGNGQGLIIKR
jgi:O-methyltransferase